MRGLQSLWRQESEREKGRESGANAGGFLAIPLFWPSHSWTGEFHLRGAGQRGKGDQCQG